MQFQYRSQRIEQISDKIRNYSSHLRTSKWLTCQLAFVLSDCVAHYWAYYNAGICSAVIPLVFTTQLQRHYLLSSYYAGIYSLVRKVADLYIGYNGSPTGDAPHARWFGDVFLLFVVGVRRVTARPFCLTSIEQSPLQAVVVVCCLLECEQPQTDAHLRLQFTAHKHTDTHTHTYTWTLVRLDIYT